MRAQRKKKTTGVEPITTSANVDCCKQIVVANILGVTRKTISEWTVNGCPRNGDDTYSVPLVFEWHRRWLKQSFKSSNRSDREQELKIEKMELQNAKLRREMISIEEHNAVLSSRASVWNEFWDKAITKNIHHFAQQPRQKLKVLLHDFGAQLSDIWSLHEAADD